MKKYLYVLKAMHETLLIFENERVKYFECNEENHIDILEEFLEEKAKYGFTRVIKEADYVYYGEEYRIVLIELCKLEEIKNDQIKLFNQVNSENLDYKDLEMLKVFSAYECRVNKLDNSVKFGKRERETTLKIVIMSVVISLLIAMFSISFEGINNLGIYIPLVTILTSFSGVFISGKKKKINIIGVYFIGVAIVLSITYGIFTNPVFRILNLILIGISQVIGLYMFSYEDVDLTYSNVFNRIFSNMMAGLFGSANLDMISKSLKARKSEEKDNELSGVIKGLIISIPLVIVLLYLLSSADLMFGEVLGDLFGAFENLFTLEGVFTNSLRVAVFIIFFILIYFLLTSLKMTEVYIKNKKVKTLDKNMMNTILTVVNLLYIVFTFIQIKYLFLKSGNVLDSSEYASYARSGFFQLILVVVINILLIMFFKKRINRNKYTSILNTLMTLISINMAITSIYKMNLYIGEYGLTRLRFLTSVFMIFVIISLIFIAISLWKNINLFKYTIIIGSFMYICINYCNMDKVIANYNLNNPNINSDATYLTSLSLDCYHEVEGAYKDGKINEGDFYDYKVNRVREPKWYQWNYYNNIS